jgi:hypothetical protein
MATIFGARVRWQLVVAAVVALAFAPAVAAAVVAVDDPAFDLLLPQATRVPPTKMPRARTRMDRCTFPPLLIGLERVVRLVSPPTPPSPVAHIVSFRPLACCAMKLGR